MSRNGSGTFTPSVNFATEAASAPIEISKLDTVLVDIAAGLTASIASDGQTNPSADLPMNGKKHTNVGAATALNHYARVSELIDQDHIYYVDSGAANAYVITPSPAIGSYEEGQRFVIRATNTNTGASTLNVNGEGAIAIQDSGGNAMTAGVLEAGGIYEFTYDANTTPDRFVLTSPGAIVPDARLSSNVPKLDTANVFTAGQQVSASSPFIGVTNTSATSGEQTWFFNVSNSGTFELYASPADGTLTTIGASRLLGAGRTADNLDVLTITADSVTIADSEVLTAAVIAALTAIDVSALAATDGIYVDDGGVAKRMAVQDMGIRLLSTSLAKTFALTDANALNQLSGSTNRTWTIPAAASVAFNDGAVIYPASVGTATITLDPASGVTINSEIAQASTDSRTVPPGATAVLIYLGSDVWQLGGGYA